MATRQTIRQATGSQRIGEMQSRQQRDEFRIGLRALLMQPLMDPRARRLPRSAPPG